MEQNELDLIYILDTPRWAKDWIKVMEIQEDVDFGCEERSEGSPVMAVVLLRGEDGSEMMTRQADQMLYDGGIEEGDSVVFDERYELVKLL